MNTRDKIQKIINNMDKERKELATLANKLYREEYNADAKYSIEYKKLLRTMGFVI